MSWTRTVTEPGIYWYRLQPDMPVRTIELRVRQGGQLYSEAHTNREGFFLPWSQIHGEIWDSPLVFCETSGEVSKKVVRLNKESCRPTDFVSGSGTFVVDYEYSQGHFGVELTKDPLKAKDFTSKEAQFETFFLSRGGKLVDLKVTYTLHDTK